jgi:TolB-like protein/Tfp pilus assembly protein PilF
MASLFPGFEYDVFISYRQKDNKGDRWVSEFVEALKTELESTFKEEISVYFDINPHDGLLETHDVKESLHEKLKCAVFIPIISRTYCDPKSFAWENEFKAFVESASIDQFGLKVNLQKGNVASRVLPVRIHELDRADLVLCENLLKGVLRGVDFIYKSQGVNRPLRANEDNPQDNLNRTYYRDQINKVANAIDEIIRSLKSAETVYDETGNIIQNDGEITKTEDLSHKSKTQITITPKSKMAFAVILSVLFCALVAGYIFFNRSETLKTIAILPFRCQGNDPELIAKGEILTEVALAKLHRVKKLILRSRVSTSQYRDTEKSLNTIRKELDVYYIVDGSIRREGSRIIFWIGLIDAKDDKQLWSNEYVWADENISAIISEIAKNISGGCSAEPSPEELIQIERDPTKNSIAYLNYISANVISNDSWIFFNTGNVLLDSAGFKKALREYDIAIEHDSLFADAYARRAIAMAWSYYIGQSDTSCFAECRNDIKKAFELGRDLMDANIAQGLYSYFCERDNQKALVYFNRALIQDPENYQPLFFMAAVYRKMGEWERSQRLISKVIRLNPQVALFLTNIGLSYTFLHNYDSAIIYHQKAIDIKPEWSAPYINMIESLLLLHGKTTEAKAVLESAVTKTGVNLKPLAIQVAIYDGKLKDALYETDHSRPEDFKIDGEKYLYYANIYNLQKETGNAIKYYDSALVSLSGAKDIENNYRVHSLLGIAYAGTGNKAKALEEAKLSVDLSVKNKMDESDMKLNQAIVYTMIGDFNNAIINIEYLLDNPSMLSVGLLQLDPVWKPLMKLPEIKTLVAKYTKN